MGNGYDQQSIHRHFHHKTICLPMFCRLSIKDIALNNHCKTPISGDGEPSSPKVSCMGQVKTNNRVLGFPAAAAGAGATHHHRYSKLKRLFSSKNLVPPTISSMTATASGAAAAGGGHSRSKSFRSGRKVCVKNLRRLRLNNECERDCVKVVNIGEIDPPLPVVKKVAPTGVGRDEVSLWRRRFNGGAALKGLQIDQIRNLRNSNAISQPPIV